MQQSATGCRQSNRILLLVGAFEGSRSTSFSVGVLGLASAAAGKSPAKSLQAWPAVQEAGF